MKYDEKKYLKKEPIVLKQKYKTLFTNLNQKQLAFDERIIRHLGNNIGVRSSD